MTRSGNQLTTTSYLAAQNSRSMAAPLLLNIFNTVESTAPIFGSIFALLMGIELVYVFVKYVITSTK